MADRPLNIVHVFRAPVGGLFRHVLDLARGQIVRGHRVGLIADNSDNERAARALGEIAPQLALGLHRLAMPREPTPRDLLALHRISTIVTAANADILHGHGAKGGLYARLARGRQDTVRAYTPHGGSLHYNPRSIVGAVYLGTERLLMRRGRLYLFESSYSRDVFRAKVGAPPGVVRVVHNGVSAEEFEPVTPAATAADFVFLGELRHLKGVDVLIDAIAALRRMGRTPTAVLVGDGPDRAAFTAQIETLGLGDCIRLEQPMPARQAFALGRTVVVPSRAESLPYVVLEAAAAGKPLLATKVGGIGEIFGPLADRLVAPSDTAALASAMAGTLDAPAESNATAAALRERVRAGFSTGVMVDGILAAYREAGAGAP